MKLPALLLSVLPAVAWAQGAPAPWTLASPDTRSGIALVQVAPGVSADGTASLRRPRPALRMRSEMAESAVRSLGLDASDCAMLLRMHSRAAGTAVVLNPQMHLDCRF